MRYGIVSDIHGNLEALQAVLRECQRLAVQIVVSAGDIVGYGANPKECLELLRRLKIVSVAGNHDWAVGGRLDFSHFTDDGKAAVEWTRAQISMDDIAYLNALELSLQNKDFVLAHASLHEPQQFMYMTGVSKVIPSFALMDVPVCFIGHTHVPGIFLQVEGQAYYQESSNIDINPQHKYVINPGSVGQPRDGNPMASFCVYDSQLQTIELRRVPYDIQEVQGKILEAGLPQNLARRLALGQ